MTSNHAYEATGDLNNDVNENEVNRRNDPAAIRTISSSQRVQADEGTLLTVGATDTYFSDEKVPIPDVDKVNEW